VKKCRDRNTGRFIPYSALIARGLNADWLTLDELDKLDREGIEFVDNTSDEILELVREMNQRLDGAWRPGADDDALMQQFRAIWPATCFDGSEFPGRVSAAFLRENRGLIGA
jgi:putative glycosyltransferase (TIGR04372 family)